MRAVWYQAPLTPLPHTVCEELLFKGQNNANTLTGAHFEAPGEAKQAFGGQRKHSYNEKDDERGIYLKI